MHLAAPPDGAVPHPVERVDEQPSDRRSQVAAGCIDAGFTSYQRLPAFDAALPLRTFREEGRAFRDLRHTLTQLARRGCVLSNPFNPSTTILFTLARRAHVRLKVFDLLGRQCGTLVDRELPAGIHLRI